METILWQADSDRVPTLSPFAELQRLDPQADYQRIVYLVYGHEFRFDMDLGTHLALVRTFCIPRISAILHGSGEFRQRAQKRFDDTDILLTTLVVRGLDGEAGLKAMQRMNEIHGRFPIAQEDYLYVLSTFIYEPVRWIARHGWRPMLPQERLGLYHFWREIGTRMGIQDIPATDEAFEAFNVAYEQANLRFSQSNQLVMADVWRLLLARVPRLLKGPLERVAAVVLGDAVAAAVGFRPAQPAARVLVTGVLRLRAAAVRWLPFRPAAHRLARRFETYPQGYRLEEVGPPP